MAASQPLRQLPNDRGAPPGLVLDTNVVLAWLLFEDPACEQLEAAIVSARLRWVASAAMRDELVHVLGRGIARGWKRDTRSVLERWERWATIIEPWDQPSPRNLRCSDTDDQKFIDLALQIRAAALVSRDRAVLKLARRAALQGLAIVTLAQWDAAPGHGAPS